MKLVYFGTGSFALPALRALAPHVSLVVTQPDRPSGRGMRLQPSPAKALALELGIAVETPEKSRAPEFVERLLEEEADALVDHIKNRQESDALGPDLPGHAR